MNLNNLKPAWRQFQLQNSMQALSQNELLLMIEKAEPINVSKTNTYVMHVFMFVVLTCCSQGG